MDSIPFCPNCGKKVSETDKFCFNCGARLVGKEEKVPTERAQMYICDVCNKKMYIPFEDGYVLSTTQVATSESYWEFTFTHQWSSIHEFDPEGDTIAMLVQRQTFQSTGWLVCESCIQLFNVNREVAKGYAKIAGSSLHPGDYCPPGGGRANPVAVALAAARAWKKLYGKWPRSIEK